MSLPENLMLPSKIRHAFTAALLGMLLVGLSLAMSCKGPGCAAEQREQVESAAHLLFAPVEIETETGLTNAHITGDANAIATPAMATSTSTDARTTSSSSDQASSDDRVRVRFSKDRLYELIFVSVTESEELDPKPADLRRADEGLQAWGARRVGSFRVLASRSQDLEAQWVHLVEWPSSEARLLAQDEELHLAPQVAGLLSSHRRGTFQATEDGEVYFRSDKAYEFSGLTLHAGVAARASLHRYHQILTPIQQSYGGGYPRTILDLHPAGLNHLGSYHHARQALIEWDSVDDQDKLLANSDFQNRALPYRQRAIQSSDSVITKFVLPN
jgi:hypothetical protein